ncbi:thiamine pyrophosphate-dependent enzyme, partial [Klebsiella pneumoniae]|nr:ABC transporter substrate-binding protein [Klebsiella pneumoniae]
EAINMAVVLQLPAVFIFENNGYGEGTGHDYAVGGRDIARRAAGFGLPAVTVDGTDFFAVYEATSEAVKRAREGGGPSVIEAKAFRWHGHFEGDPALYRAEGEVQRLREQHDPLKIFTAKVKQHITQEELAAIDEEVEALVNDAVLKARAAAYPAPEDLLTDVYVSY